MFTSSIVPLGPSSYSPLSPWSLTATPTPASTRRSPCSTDAFHDSGPFPKCIVYLFLIFVITFTVIGSFPYPSPLFVGPRLPFSSILFLIHPLRPRTLVAFLHAPLPVYAFHSGVPRPRTSMHFHRSFLVDEMWRKSTAYPSLRTLALHPPTPHTHSPARYWLAAHRLPSAREHAQLTGARPAADTLAAVAQWSPALSAASFHLPFTLLCSPVPRLGYL